MATTTSSIGPLLTSGIRKAFYDLYRDVTYGQSSEEAMAADPNGLDDWSWLGADRDGRYMDGKAFVLSSDDHRWVIQRRARR